MTRTKSASLVCWLGFLVRPEVLQSLSSLFLYLAKRTGMGKKGDKNLKAANSHREEEMEEEQLHLRSTASSAVALLSSDDDVEGNKDLSLDIVKKSLLRACNSVQRDADSDELKDAAGLSLCRSPAPEGADNGVKARKSQTKVKKVKKKLKKVEKLEETVSVAKDEENAGISKVFENVETDAVDNSDNLVLRKLLRGPRYFDPPENGWGACYNCGKEGHTAVNCNSAKQRRACFICGSLEHDAKQCMKGQDCFICKKEGHRAKDCPEKYKGASKISKICLRCGDSGHDMFSCKNDYSKDDLKEIQCYICKSFGHLCCADFTDSSPRELSCYRCGQLGHGGLDCGKESGKSRKKKTISQSLECFRCGGEGHFVQDCPYSTKDFDKARSESGTFPSTDSCFKCGEKGHFARKCPNSTKNCGRAGHVAMECFQLDEGRKRNPELSTPKKKFMKEKVKFKEARSVPSEVGKAQKGRKVRYEGQSPRGGWIPKDSIDLYSTEFDMDRWGSPVTPINNVNKLHTLGVGGHSAVCHYPTDTTHLFRSNGLSSLNVVIPSNGKYPSQVPSNGPPPPYGADTSSRVHLSNTPYKYGVAASNVPYKYEIAATSEPYPSYRTPLHTGSPSYTTPPPSLAGSFSYRTVSPSDRPCYSSGPSNNFSQKYRRSRFSNFDRGSAPRNNHHYL